MLNQLADDPDAPPTTVSASSVLAAAKASGADRPIENSVAEPDQSVPGTAVAVRRTATVAPLAEARSGVSVPAGAQHRRNLDQDLAQRRAQRRRRGLIGLIAAASVAVLAAVVVPVVVSRGSSTTTAADGAAVSATAADAPTADDGRAQAAPSATTGADAAAGSAAEVAPGQAGELSERPAPGPDAITERVPVEDVPGASASGDAATTAAPSGPAEASCWPELSEQAAAALSAALPAGAFASPGPLNLDCGTDPVAGALATGPTTRALAVRVTKADPGNCTRSAGEAAVLCVPRSDGSYVATDGGGMITAFVYGNGYQVEIGPPSTPGTAAPSDTGLSADELVVVAQAVLSALG